MSGTASETYESLMCGPPRQRVRSPATQGEARQRSVTTQAPAHERKDY